MMEIAGITHQEQTASNYESCFFFFFQAEDGIRDLTVTGVQTCALPICGTTLDRPGYDLCGVFVGSEGTLGIATKVILRVVRRPAQIQTLLAAFHSTNEAGAAVSGIIAAGVLPAAIEMMDNLAIQAAEAAVHAGYPDCGGLLLVELDGPAAEVAALMGQVREICTSCGAWELRVAQSEEERAAVWKGRN